MRAPRAKAPCADCGADTLSCKSGARAEYYMVHDHVWQQAGAPRFGWLCVGCLENRLGRQLHRGDFKKVILNSLIVSDTPRYAWSWRTRRLRDRMTAPDPVHDGIQLPLWEGDHQ
jgi:hypothetical protein